MKRKYETKIRSNGKLKQPIHGTLFYVNKVYHLTWKQWLPRRTSVDEIIMVKNIF